MKVLIMTDLEGISGVDDAAMIGDEGAGYAYACQRLMADTNAAVAGALEGGAAEVYVYDGHGGGKNFLPGALDARAHHLARFDDPDLMTSMDAYMEVGLHAMAGTFNAFYDHTQSSRSWYNYWVNGRRCGEFMQGLLFAGRYDVPFVMVSGDAAACAEAKSHVPSIACAVVKQGLGWAKAESLPEQEALAAIQRAARDGMAKVGQIRPYKPMYPLELRLELYRADMCDALMERRPQLERMDARTVRKVLTDIVHYADLTF